MIKITKRRIRVVFAAAIFILFLLSFINPGNYFARVAPLLEGVQLGPLLLKLFFSFSFVLLIPVLVLSIISALAGRVYCSFLCPLGIYQDLVRTMHRNWGGAYRRVTPFIRYTVLALLFFSVVYGVQSVFIVTDPYANFGRLSTTIFRNVYITLRNVLVHGLNLFGNYSLSLEEHPATNIENIIVALITFVLISVLAYRFGRLYCNLLCPVGALLGIISKKSPFKMTINSGCISCKKCEYGCKSECINIEEKSIDNERCVRCFNCEDVCPVDAIALDWVKAKNKKQSKSPHSKIKDGTIFSRKEFIHKGKYALLSICALTSIPLRSFFKGSLPFAVHKQKVIIPPGAGNIARYSQSCIGCHLCTAVCPTKIIRPSTSQFGLAGVLQPLLEFKNGFCEFNCNLCSTVCPTDAIKPITIEKKQQTRIGYARLGIHKCIVHLDGTDCGACAEHCPTGAVSMRERGDLAFPNMQDDICIGCGACEYICPAQPKAFFIEPLDTHERIVKNKEDSDSRVIDESDFPF